MRAYAMTGDTSAAADVFQQCRATLYSELGVDVERVIVAQEDVRAQQRRDGLVVELRLVDVRRLDMPVQPADDGEPPRRGRAHLRRMAPVGGRRMGALLLTVKAENGGRLP